ncbi:MAG: hypothetical protein M3Z22_00825, partial [Verrucomicrobiota bacterium]|nr:hypothetical protein [Verrucomicrobiota bacterium]
KSNRGEIVEDIAIREESMRQLLAHMNAMQTAYEKLGALTWIVGGDFNTAPDDSRLKNEKTTEMLLRAGFHWSWQEVPFANRITMPGDGRYPPASFDHIFFRNAALMHAEVLPTLKTSSDHRAVRAQLDLTTSR